MISRWTVEDLDPDKLFEVGYNRDPETGSRFSFPIPNWLDAEGKPREEFQHDNLTFSEKKNEWRFKFINYLDGCEQLVKADGTGCILFMTPTGGQSIEMKNIISAYGAHGELTPAQVGEALDAIYSATNIFDRWNESVKDIERKYDAVDSQSDYLGRFVYKQSVSSALYIEGSGYFDGVAASDQRFEGGAFIVFPDKTREQAQSIIGEYDSVRPTKTGAKVVAQTEFLKTRRHLDGSPIKLYEIPSQTTPYRRFYVPKAIPGFQDNSVEREAIEGQWLRIVEDVYKTYGYPKIKTRAVEELSVLRREEGGEPDKTQIFSLSPTFSNLALGLRFDHTVPLARYIAENRSNIQSPFKSARIGPVWRSREVKRGNPREFIQADIDIVDIDHVDHRYDSEFPRIMVEIVDKLGISNVEIGISNRKITQGFFEAHGWDESLIKDVVRLIELRHEIGIDGVVSKMSDTLRLDAATIDLAIQFAQTQTRTGDIREMLASIANTQSLINGGKAELLETGIAELQELMNDINDLPEGSVTADMSVVRGMQYYTGTVYEGRCTKHRDFPPIIVGGRYDNLVGHYMKENRPGVGISFDVTRAIDLLVRRQNLPLGPRTSTQVLVAYKNHQQLSVADDKAKILRARGIAAEVVYGFDELKPQMRYADRKKIPYVLFIDENGAEEIRDMRNATQTATDIRELTLKL